MILQALKEYYDRKPELPRLGFEMKEIPYLIVLDTNGRVVDLQSTREMEGKKLRAKRFLVPQTIKRSVGVAANLLWDNPEYVLGINLKGKPKRVKEQHEAFNKRISELDELKDIGLDAVRKFLVEKDKASLLQPFSDTFEELKKDGGNITFQLSGDGCPVVERPAVRKVLGEIASAGDKVESICMISGEREEIERLHTAIKGVWGAQSSGANIVSFNLDAFKSYGKEQGCNAPVGKKTTFAYTTALNHLLGRDSSQRIQVGDASTVFWAAKDTEFENAFGAFFEELPKDDPDRNTKAVESLFKAPQTGALVEEHKTRFYVLGLAPNASRIAVRFWIVDTVSGMAGKMRQHFEDIRITHGPKDRDAISLFRLLVSTAAQGKSENISPNLTGETIRAILAGLPYPRTLLQSVIRRILAEHEITHPRAAIIKAYINRLERYRNPENREELKVSLDTTNVNIGYRLGRLFAMLEKIQQEANPGINATIRDKFYGAASGTPVAVFGNLMRLKNHHLAKLENSGRRIFFEKLLGEILSEVKDFPPHLALNDQGRFAIGYYHQMQDFFTKKTEKTTEKGDGQ